MAYHERLIAPASWWLFAAGMVASVWLAMIVAIPERAAWWVTALAVVLAAALLGRISSTTVSVDATSVCAGPARLPVRFVGNVTVLDAQETKQVLGVNADARAFLVVKPYVREAVKVELTDPDDPTPYWVISSRRPEELAASVRATLDAPAAQGGS